MPVKAIPGARKVYKYRSPGHTPPVRAVNRIDPVTETEQLTKLVQGQKASDLEERFSRALDKLTSAGVSYDFQPSFIAGRNLPGEIRLDFMVYDPTPMPVQVDGEFAHKSAEQRNQDAVKDALLDEHLRQVGAGAQPTLRIPGYELDDQDLADQYVRENF